MPKRTIEITFEPDGSCQIEAQNFTGADCEAATKAFEDALGTVAQRDHKPEYRKRATRQTQQRLGGN